jgi:hypothetical protein
LKDSVMGPFSRILWIWPPAQLNSAKHSLRHRIT